MICKIFSFGFWLILFFQGDLLVETKFIKTNILVYVYVTLGFDNSCSAENLASLCLQDRPQSGTIQGQKIIGSRGAPLPGKAPIDRKLGFI